MSFNVCPYLEEEPVLEPTPVLEVMVLSEVLVQVAHAERERPSCELRIMSKERMGISGVVLPQGQRGFLLS